MNIKALKKRKAEALKKAKLTSFGQFCIETKGYLFWNQSGTQLDKWEVFESLKAKGLQGFRHFDSIVSGLTSINYKIRKP